MRLRLPLCTTHLRPGMRLAVGLSGGADSVALLRALAEEGRELGLVLHAAHLHHGLRGAEADADLAFCRNLAARLNIPFHEACVDTAAEARPGPDPLDSSRTKPAESLEEAARRLRYAWFQQLISQIPLDAIATAHTLDDQAETVLAKILRGAWTEGLSGIHPKLESPEGGCVIRPLLATTRAQVEEFLRALGQPWRTDSSNADTAFTRNRIRHELLPVLDEFNARLREHLAQMATLARDEEAYWQSELDRMAPQLLLTGRPVRGGGRAASPGNQAALAIDITRLAALAPALQRRLLRHAAARLGVSLAFPSPESLRSLALTGRAGQKLPLAGGLLAERTHRELRLAPDAVSPAKDSPAAGVTNYVVTLPGDTHAPAFGLTLHVACDPANPPAGTALLRPWKPGDRVRLRHSSAPRKVKEVLERMKVTGSDRALWPVLALEGRILWMRGVELEPESGLRITA
ncbi:MAG TPA: tRNA lysidine(34) synthetase TilS, partial [Terracidiphilus sp.]|nr:tRNA lysidine(34) synthetase TilS [Terracidiphilus sp.]